jgi:amidase
VDPVELAYAGVARHAELVRAGEISSVELVEVTLARIERLNPLLGAFTAVDGARALSAAHACDAARMGGDERPLLGVPVAVKQDCDVEGFVTTFGGAANLTPARADGELVRRLREAGAVIIGKTAMPEFGQFPFTESSAWGYCRNPWDLTRTPGGSSGGTAAAVAAGLVGGGFGSDGGGSVRIPAAHCGVFGLKTQRGRISAAPGEALWEALGVFGPLTRRVADAALLADVVRGATAIDRYRAHEPRMRFVDAASTSPGRMRIGVARRSPLRGMRLDGEHAAALEQTAELLRGLGHDVREVEPAYPDTTLAFGPQFYGGVREEARGVGRPDLLERRTKQTLAIGHLFPRAVVRWAISYGERLSAQLNQIFATHDALLTPVVAARPRRVGALDGLGTIRASLRSLPSIAYAAVWNVCGNPAVSVPAGIAADGVPVAVQLVAAPHDEPTIIALARQLEQARPWEDRRPPLG